MYVVVVESDLLVQTIESKWEDVAYANTEFMRQTSVILKGNCAGSVSLQFHFEDHPRRIEELAFFRFTPDPVG